MTVAVFRVNNAPVMNDFLRSCNCVHPAEQDCEKCIEEVAVKTPPGAREEKVPQKKTEPVESEKKV